MRLGSRSKSYQSIVSIDVNKNEERELYLAGSIPFILIEEGVEGDWISCLARNAVLIGLSGREWLRILKSKLKTVSQARPCLRLATHSQLRVSPTDHQGDL